MRDLKVVMKAIVDVVPDDDSRKLQLMQRVSSISDSLVYAAPELVPMWWNEFANTLGELFPKVDTSWQEQMRDLFADKVRGSSDA